MDISLCQALIRLTEPARLQVRDGSGQRVCCVDGKVWITQEGDQRDVILNAGECFVLDRHGLAIIGALGAGDIVLPDARSGSATPKVTCAPVPARPSPPICPLSVPGITTPRTPSRRA